jgi:hypothetical protein
MLILHAKITSTPDCKAAQNMFQAFGGCFRERKSYNSVHDQGKLQNSQVEKSLVSIDGETSVKLYPG